MQARFVYVCSQVAEVALFVVAGLALAAGLLTLK